MIEWMRSADKDIVLDAKKVKLVSTVNGLTTEKHTTVWHILEQC